MKQGSTPLCSGQMLAEMALAFPVHLLITFGILQMGLLSMGRAHVQYAAFAAARSALAEPAPAGTGNSRTVNPKRAAQIALLPVAGTSLPWVGRLPAAPWSGALRKVPGLARLSDPARMAAAAAKTRVDVKRQSDWVRARVEHDFELVVPGVNRLFSLAGGLLGRDADLALKYRVPHLRIVDTCTLYR